MMWVLLPESPNTPWDMRSQKLLCSSILKAPSSQSRLNISDLGNILLQSRWILWVENGVSQKVARDENGLERKLYLKT